MKWKVQTHKDARQTPVLKVRRTSSHRAQSTMGCARSREGSGGLRKESSQALEGREEKQNWVMEENYNNKGPDLEIVPYH